MEVDDDAKRCAANRATIHSPDDLLGIMSLFIYRQATHVAPWSLERWIEWMDENPDKWK